MRSDQFHTHNRNASKRIIRSRLESRIPEIGQNIYHRVKLI